MNELENKIKSLEEKVLWLEKAEKKRRRNKLIGIIFKIIIAIIVVIIGYKAYLYVNETYIKPYNEYKETLDEIKKDYDSIKDYTGIASSIGKRRS